MSLHKFPGEQQTQEFSPVVTLHIFNIHFNIIILPTLLSPELPFPFRAVRPIIYLTSQADTSTLKLDIVFVVCVRQWRR